MIRKYFCIYLLLFSCSTNVFYKNNSFEEYYDLNIGDLPVFLVASHDGKMNLDPLVTVRSDTLTPNFNIKNDVNTYEIPDFISQEIYNKTNYKPYQLVNNIHRKYIDLNRHSDQAYEDQYMTAYYNNYHKIMNEQIQSIIKKFGKCLLIDIHGFFSDSIDIVISTRNNNTLSILDKKRILTNNNSFLNNYITQGYNVNLNDPFYGGFTIKNTKEKSIYSSFSAIQLEIGSNIRYKNEKLMHFIENTSYNIILYLNESGFL